MNQCETILFIGLILCYLLAFGLYHLMVFRVNVQLPPDRRIPHSLYFGGWNTLARQYKGLYPRSSLYQFTLTCAVACLIIAAGFAAFRVWEYATRR
jgi:hypothetical protein